MAKDMPINQRIVEQLANATVRNLVDGIVELVTNSDDSYRRLEEKGEQVDGRIEIYVNREKGGICKKLVVKDFAEGMTKEELEKAIEFGGETSGFGTGKKVRGLFGRGLKETIIALGEGEIKTVKNGKLCRTKLWRISGRYQYDDELLQQVQETSENNGTEIDITITNPRITIPQHERFKEQLSKHYALRDIMASRKIWLKFEDLGKKGKPIYENKVTFSYPEGKKVLEKELNLPQYDDKVKIVIYESETRLDSPRNNPYGLAGILIKTKGAILDNQLFKFDNDQAAGYFFGDAICDNLAERLREGETGIIDPNRRGLEWGHDYCQSLQKAIEEILEPLVLNKRKALEKNPAKEVAEPLKKKIRSLCSSLNKLAKDVWEDVPEVPVAPDSDIADLVIKPEVANIQKDKPRKFSIYAPKEMVNNEGTNEALIKSDTLDIQPLASVVILNEHPKYPEKICYNYFDVVGKGENAEGTVTVKLGEKTASAKVKIAPYKERKKGTLICGRKGGFISDIKPDESESPTQRTFYDKDTGIIKIFVKFPAVATLIKSGLEGAETPEGKILLAELVGEAFCKELARRILETNPPPPGGEIDAFNVEVNKIQSKTLHKIQEIIRDWKFG